MIILGMSVVPAGLNVLNTDARTVYTNAAIHLGRAFLLADQPDPAMEHPPPAIPRLRS